MSESLPPIVCLSHLAWEQTLFQRPQQIMSRMAARGHDVLYLSKISTKRWWMDRLRGRADRNASRPGEQPQYRNAPWFPLANRFPPLRRVDEHRMCAAIHDWLRKRHNDDAILWLYHPCFLPYVDRIPHQTLVYDVMDHFAGFKLSRRDVRSIEEELLKRADVVFTGGRALQEANVTRRPDSVCFPSGIDIEHFSKAQDPALKIPDDLRSIPGTILGYFGAVDERLDFTLVGDVCRAHPDWHIVFLGPLIPGTELSIQEPNFHWLGPKSYADLPAYLKGFDVCLMPWVQSELTAHISPTKTPEYLAGGKPVVSVPIKDVLRDYGDVVFFGEGPDGFARAVDQALAARGRDWVVTLHGRAAARTWDQIAEQMDGLILQAKEERKENGP